MTKKIENLQQSVDSALDEFTNSLQSVMDKASPKNLMKETTDKAKETVSDPKFMIAGGGIIASILGLFITKSVVKNIFRRIRYRNK